MIKYFENREIDNVKWDYCIKNSVNGMVYGYSWYLDIVSPGWGALIENDYQSVMPLPQATKYRFKYIYPPPFTQQLGVFSVVGLTAERVRNFVAGIPERFKYVEMNLNTLNPISSIELNSRALVTHLLDLITPYNKISSNYSTQAKRNLRKAMLSQLDVRQEIPPALIIELFKANRGKEFRIPANHYKILENLIQICIQKNVGMTWGVFTPKNELCAGAFFVGSNKKEIFLFSGADDKGYELQAMTLLIDRFIRDHAEREITLDFEGSMNTNIARFYKGFGSKAVNFFQVKRNSLPYPVKWMKEYQFRKKAGSVDKPNIISTFD